MLRNFFICIILLSFPAIISAQHDKKQLLDSLFSEARKLSFNDSAKLFSSGEKVISFSKKENIPIAEAGIYFIYGNYFYLKADYAQAEKFYAQAFEIAKKNHSDTLENSIQIRRSFVEFEFGNWNKSKELFEAVIVNAEKSHDTIALIESLNGLAQVNEKQSRRDETMANYIRAISLAEKSGKKNEYAYILNNMGLLKYNNGQFEDAKKDLFLALKTAQEAGNDRIAANANLNIGLIYDDTGKKDSALFYYKSFLISSEKTGEPRSIATAFVNLTSSYYDRKDYHTAMLYCDSAMKIISEKNLVEMKPKALINLAQVYRKKNQSQKAMEFLSLALDAAKQINAYDDMAFCYNFQSEISAEQKKFEDAFTQFQLYKSYNDSVNNISAKKKMAELQVQYDVEQKENELLKEKNKVQLLETENEVKQERQKLIIFSSVSLLLLLIIVFYNRHIRLSKKQQEIFSRKLIEDIEKERNRIAKDLHDDVGASLSMIKNKMFVNQKNQPGYEEVNSDISKVIERTRTISHQLYPSYLEKTGLNSVITEFTGKAERDSGLMFFTEAEEVDANLLPEEKAHIFRIVQECVNNTLKYAQANAVKLSLTKYKSGIKMVYQDNGIGISKKNSSDGIGMMSIRERTKILNGDFSVGDNDGKGVKFTFTFFP